MSATQDLIAAALTLCDVSATDYEGAYRAKRDLREACARAMVQPVGEVPMPDTCGELSDGRKIFDEADVRIYGEQCRGAGYAAGVAAIGWRDVADELPKEAQEVLFVRGGKTLHGAWIGGIFWHSNQKMVAAKWMPLPAPKIDAALRGEVK